MKNLIKIERLTAEADKLGMSYGNYVVFLKQKQEKAKKRKGPKKAGGRS